MTKKSYSEKFQDAAIDTLEKFNQTKYITEFKKKNYRRFVIDVRYDNRRIIDRLESVENRSSYIIGLVEKDIESGI